MLSELSPVSPSPSLYPFSNPESYSGLLKVPEFRHLHQEMVNECRHPGDYYRLEG